MNINIYDLKPIVKARYTDEIPYTVTINKVRICYLADMECNNCHKLFVTNTRKNYGNLPKFCSRECSYNIQRTSRKSNHIKK